MPHLRGRVTSVTHRDTFTGETLARIAPEGDNPRRISHLFWGHFANGFTPGECLTVYGEWHQHPLHGKVFRVSKIDRHPPMTREGEIQYLAGMVMGLSKKKAAELLEWADGLSAFMRICQEEPGRLEEVLPRARKLRARLRNVQWRTAEVDVDAFVALQSAGLRLHQIQQLARFFGPSNLKKIAQHSPYDFCQVPKVGFASAEKVAHFYAKAQGRPIDLFNEERLVYGICDVVAQERHRGHVCVSEERVIQRALRHLKLPHTRDAIANVQAALGTALKRRLLIKEYDRIYTRGLYKAETDLATRLAKLLVAGARPLTVSAHQIRRDLQNSGLSEEQINAVVCLATSPVSLLIGGPGRGKTRTLKSFVQLLEKYRRSYLILAPTGRAAKRAQEMTGKDAYTIHKACGLDQEEDVHSKRYGRPLGRREKLRTDVIIVDEASMIDLALMFELVRRIRPGHTALVLVGDPDQLPPVSAGQVLIDLLASGAIPTARLTQVFRQAEGSLIVSGADAINQGNIPDFATTGYEVRLFDPTALASRSRELSTNQANDLEIRTLRRWLCQAIQKYAKDLDLNPLRDIQVYAPQRTGPLGLIQLNNVLQDLLNPAKSRSAHGVLKIADGFVVRPGDKVMQTRNNYRLRLATASVGALQHARNKTPATEIPKEIQAEHVAVMNGQIGYVERVDAVRGELHVRFDEFPAPVVYLRSDEWRQLAPAYAISIHRAQGSETPYAFIVLHQSMNPHLMDRTLVYTAWTRAQRGVAVFAPRATFADAISRTNASARESNLDKRLAQVAKRRSSRPILLAAS